MTCPLCDREHTAAAPCLVGVLLVCGGRRFAARLAAFDALDRMARRMVIKCVRHGAAKGADSMADEWGHARGYPVERFPADWSRGCLAGYERNRRMAHTDPRPVACVAFPGGAGTASMADLCRYADIPVWRVPVPLGAA